MGKNRITADCLVKTFTKNEKKSRKVDVNAVDGISMTVQEGEIVGILGPNGADSGQDRRSERNRKDDASADDVPIDAAHAWYGEHSNRRRRNNG